MNAQPDQREWYTCPRPDDDVPAKPTYAGRLDRARRNRSGEPAGEGLSIVELLRRLGQPDAATRVEAQRKLEDHPASWRTWNDDIETYTAPWFFAVLHRRCQHVWKGPVGNLHTAGDLAHEVWMKYTDEIGKPTFRGYRHLATGDEPWKVLCTVFTSIARNRLSNESSGSLGHLARITVADLRETLALIERARAALAAGSPAPPWLDAIVAGKLNRDEVVHMIEAIAGYGEPGAMLVLTKAQAVIARRIIRRHPKALEHLTAASEAALADDESGEEDPDGGDEDADEETEV